MGSDERPPNALMQQINSQSAAMQSPYGRQNPSPAVPGQDTTLTPQQQQQHQQEQTQHQQTQSVTSQPRILVPDSSPDHKHQQNHGLPPGGFLLPDQGNGFSQSSVPPHLHSSQGRPPPEQMMDPSSISRADGAPPPKKRLMRFGDIEQPQAPLNPAAGAAATTSNFSRSSSSDTIASQMNHYSILSQQNSATGSPAPMGSPALEASTTNGQDSVAGGSGPIETHNGTPSGQSASPIPPQAPGNAASQPAQPHSEDEFRRFKASWPHLSDEVVREALVKSNWKPGEATQLLCNSNPLLDGYNGGTSPAAPAPLPAGQRSAISYAQPQQHQHQQQPQYGMPNQFQPPNAGFPRMPGHPQQQPHPQQQSRMSPQMQQLPNMHPQQQQRPYPVQHSNNTMFMPPGMPRPGMSAGHPPQYLASGNNMYRGPPNHALSQHPHQPFPQQPRPGFNPVVSTRSIMPQTAGPIVNPQALHNFMLSKNMDPANQQHRQTAASMLQQTQRRPQINDLNAQRQALQNPAEVERMRKQQTAAHAAQVAAQHKKAAHQARQGQGKHAVSKLVAAHRPQAASASSSTSARKQKRKHADSDSEDGGNWSDASDGGAKYEEYVNVEKEGEAVVFFNTCAPEQLPDYTACTPEAAQAIVSLRPFESPDDIRAKLKKTKGISNKLFDSVVDVFEAYQHVDRVFAECAGYGRELSQIMRVWSGVSKQARAGRPEDTKSLLMPGQAGESNHQEGTPDIETGVHLVELDEAALDLSTLPTAPPEVQMAFSDYIREKPPGVPDNINIKGYQMLGINWLNLLYKKRLSCILADEMGLGKTCQVITFLAHLKATNHPGPHLVVVPSSTLDNWLREFDTFAPHMKAFPYYGSQATREELRGDLKAAAELDVIVTTYNMASGNAEDRKFLRKMNFKTCVYDEGHQLKNSESKKYKDLMELRVPWRLLLTGTPLQNNLTELISLLSFILPTTFAQVQDSLKAIFKVPPAAQANMLSRRRIESAKKVMTPFVLRRKKHQVLQELPAKREHIIHCEMTPEQKALYRESMQKSKRFLAEEQQFETMPDDPPKKGRGRPPKKPVTKQAENSSNILMDLRKAANHPMLFRRLYDDKKIAVMSKDCLKEPEFSDRDATYIEEDMSLMTDFELHRFVQPYKYLVKHSLENEPWMKSGKVEWLSKNILEMRERGDRILLFSQFTQVLDLLEAVLGTLGVKYLKLTGQTNVAERQDLVDEYYADPEITVFLLSTRAGGLGLNLAAANVVILHDQDFNPHNDKQAEDRAWRIGQTRDVNVIRLVMKDTIEEDILAMATTKLTLDSEISKVEGDEPGAASGGSGAGAGGEGAKEGDESATEKHVKSSLLRNIRAKLEQTEGEEAKAAEAMSQQLAAAAAAEQQQQQRQQAETGSEIKVEP